MQATKTLLLAAALLGGAAGWAQIQIHHMGTMQSSSCRTFSYSGGTQTFTVPAGVSSLQVECWGAQGWSGSNAGGLGGYAKATVAVTPGTTVYVFVGQQGQACNVANAPGPASYNGGGAGGANGTTGRSGGGGGASDVRMGGSGLANRIVVAGGGGGSTDNASCTGGSGGGSSGGDGGGGYGLGGGATPSAGGTGPAGGSLGFGGSATLSILNTGPGWYGGGGGGRYGGGLGSTHGPGGGGSGYTGGVSPYTTSSPSMSSGVRSGDGQVLITY